MAGATSDEQHIVQSWQDLMLWGPSYLHNRDDSTRQYRPHHIHKQAHIRRLNQELLDAVKAAHETHPPDTT